MGVWLSWDDALNKQSGELFVAKVRKGYACSAGLPKELNHGGMAQLVERLVRNEKAAGSNPTISTNFFLAHKVYF